MESRILLAVVGLLAVLAVPRADAAFSFINSIQPGTGGAPLRDPFPLGAAAISANASNTFSYWATYSMPCNVYKIFLNLYNLRWGPTANGAASQQLAAGNGYAMSLCMDTFNDRKGQFIFVGLSTKSYTESASVARINIKWYKPADTGSFIKFPNTDVNAFSSCVTTGTTTFWGTISWAGYSARVVETISNGNTFRFGRSRVLQSGEIWLTSVLLYSSSLYFGTYTTTGQVIRVATSSLTPSRTLVLSSGLGNLAAATLQTRRGLGYYTIDSLQILQPQDASAPGSADPYIGPVSAQSTVIQVNLGPLTHTKTLAISGVGSMGVISAVSTDSWLFVGLWSPSSDAVIARCNIFNGQLTNSAQITLTGRRNPVRMTIFPQNGSFVVGTSDGFLSKFSI
jgi:hypothetical protein